MRIALWLSLASAIVLTAVASHYHEEGRFWKFLIRGAAGSLLLILAIALFTVIKLG